MTKKTESVENPNHIENGLTLTEIQIWPVHNPEATRIKANVTIEFNGVIRVNSCRLIEGAKGVFVSFPSEKKSDEIWISFVHPVTRQASDKIQAMVVERWNAMLAAAGPTR